jgi:hypothetical protein
LTCYHFLGHQDNGADQCSGSKILTELYISNKLVMISKKYLEKKYPKNYRIYGIRGIWEGVSGKSLRFVGFSKPKDVFL